MQIIKKAKSFLISHILNIKFLKYIFIILILILSLLSVSILIIVHKELLFSEKIYFEFSIVGLDNYLSYLYKYSKIFAATITMITVYMILHNYEEKRKQDMYQDWLRRLNLNGMQIEKNDGAMLDSFKNSSHKYFEILYKYNFEIRDKIQLENIINQLFGDKEFLSSLILYYEELNKIYKAHKGYYEDEKSSYSYQSFQFIFISIFDYYYQNILDDLREIYFKNMDKARAINQNEYQKAHIQSLFSDC